MSAWKTGMMAVLLAAGLLAAGKPAQAQEPSDRAQPDCKQVRGEKISVFDGINTTTGTVIKGGWFNGTTVEVFDPGGMPTPDPTTVTFTGNLTLTTKRGELKARNVYMLDLATGEGAVLWRIDPTTSTGRFAGATGVVHTAATLVSTNPETYFEEITGEVCFAR